MRSHSLAMLAIGTLSSSACLRKARWIAHPTVSVTTDVSTALAGTQGSTMSDRMNHPISTPITTAGSRSLPRTTGGWLVSNLSSARETVLLR